MAEDHGAVVRDGPCNNQLAKQVYCRPMLVAHGRLQAFTAAEGAPVSGVRIIPSDKSDLRLKTRIEPLQDGALARVLALHPVAFSSIETNDRKSGFLAQLNAEGSEPHLDYVTLISLLTKAIQELKCEATELRQHCAGR